MTMRYWKKIVNGVCGDLLPHPEFRKHTRRDCGVFALDGGLVRSGFTVGGGNGERLGFPGVVAVAEGHGGELVTQAAVQARHLNRGPSARRFVGFSGQAGLNYRASIDEHGSGFRAAKNREAVG